ncbi:MAG TPA: efflux RND transporter periplasmic adaptor subunit [Cyclobacteriaceae bacterium]|nr:efflux RND transporter periplasmic adaptor subunit [Cyclobacteriaceae bacterium]
MHFRILSFLVVVSVAVSCGPSANEADATGNFEAEEVVVSAEANGKLLKLTLDEGTELKAGQMVGYVDTTQLHLRKKQLLYSVQAVMAKQPDASTQLATIEKQLETAKFEKKRVESLLKDDAATRKQLDDLDAQVELLQKQYVSMKTSLQITSRSLMSETLPLKAQLEQTEDQIKKSVITSPMDGLVLAKYAEESEMTATGKPIFKMANLQSLILRAYVAGNQLTSFKLGQTLQVRVDDNQGGYKTYEGVVGWVSDRAEFTPKTIQTKDERANLVYAIKVNVKNDGFLKIGMYGEVVLK